MTSLTGTGAPTAGDGRPAPTPSQTIGPFFRGGLAHPHWTELVPPGTPEEVLLTGTVYDGDGATVADVLVEVWQPDLAHDPVGARAGSGAPGFGRCETHDGGRYRFRTRRPRALDGGAPHVDLTVFGRGVLRRLVTRLYLGDEAAANAADPLLASLDPERRETLVARREGDAYVLDLHLQGERETVFLDV